MDPAPVNPGDVLAGKYRVERVLGAGGIGVVVAATHLQLDQLVALKFLLPGYVSAAAARTRFEREARAAAKLKSEHIAKVLDTGTLEDGAPYIVMEYLEGSDLSQWLAHSGRLPLTTAVDFVLQACEALAEAHARGIVHRDLKPANLFVTAGTDGTAVVKILDFGIAKTTSAVSGSDHALTSTSAIVGSPLYMSPEQLESSRDVDHRTDIWALGAILYELTTGTLPFNAATLPQLCVAVIKHPPQPPSSLVPELPQAFDAVVLHCMEKQAANRFGSVQELAQALAPFALPESRARVERISRVTAVTRFGSSSQGDGQTRESGFDQTVPTDTAREVPSPASTAQTTELMGGTGQSWGASGAGLPKKSSVWPWLLLAGGVVSALLVVVVLVVRSHARALPDPALGLAAHSGDLAAQSPPASAAPPEPAPSASSEPSVAPTTSNPEPEASSAPSSTQTPRKRSTTPAVTGKKETSAPKVGTGATWNSRE